SAAFVSGCEFSQVVAPLSSGMSPSITGAPSPDLFDIMAPPAAGFADIIIAPPSAGFADIIAPAPVIELPAPVCGAAVVGAPRAASATSRGVGAYNAGSTRAKLRTFGRSL